ncbi:hypothetical protein L484_002653 [Morus notabilis]|uniref:Uncharacterized protein n=1 Tax=Morus notabilis TaxID=981085 RepID=W9QZ40_9ROSA|nr:hypothetical protein L484_002653 [Morus notabilis]
MPHNTFTTYGANNRAENLSIEFDGFVVYVLWNRLLLGPALRTGTSKFHAMSIKAKHSTTLN